MLTLTVVGILIAACSGWYQYRSYRIACGTNVGTAQLPAPAQLTIRSNIPPLAGTFLGRDIDEKRVAAKIDGRWPIALIEGIGGVGKTALAISVGVFTVR